MKREFRAEQVGSLLRPPELLQARAAHADGRLPAAELQFLEDLAIKEAIQKQRETGVDILSDGEMRRGSWLSDMAVAASVVSCAHAAGESGCAAGV